MPNLPMHLAKVSRKVSAKACAHAKLKTSCESFNPKIRKEVIILRLKILSVLTSTPRILRIWCHYVTKESAFQGEIKG